MSSVFGRHSVASVFCDVNSLFKATDRTFYDFGLEWPDDFDKTAEIGNSRFQIIRDFKTGAYLINHGGILSPFTESKILIRRHKIKEASVIKRVGDRTTISPEIVFFLDTGLNMGNIQFMVFDLRKAKESAFESYRVILFSFPLSWLLNQVARLEETKNKQGLDDDRLQELENDRILKNPKLKGWDLLEREILPSQDEYLEILERPLHDCHFERGNQVDIWLKFEFFSI